MTIEHFSFPQYDSNTQAMLSGPMILIVLQVILLTLIVTTDSHTITYWKPAKPLTLQKCLPDKVFLSFYTLKISQEIQKLQNQGLEIQLS